METDLPWFAELSAEERSWVGLIVQAGIQDFIDWFKQDSASPSFGQAPEANLFGVAPPALAGTIPLHQTVELIRLSIEVVEQSLESILDPDDVSDTHDAVLLLRAGGRVRDGGGLRPGRGGARRLGRAAGGARRRRRAA